VYLGNPVDYELEYNILHFFYSFIAYSPYSSWPFWTFNFAECAVCVRFEVIIISLIRDGCQKYIMRGRKEWEFFFKNESGAGSSGFGLNIGWIMAMFFFLAVFAFGFQTAFIEKVSSHMSGRLNQMAVDAGRRPDL